MTVEQDVLTVEDLYVAAELGRDEDALRRVVHDRFTLNLAGGTTADKDGLIAAVLGMDMTGQTVTERSVVVEGDTAVVCGTAELHFGSGDAEPRAQLLRYTAIYIRSDERWQLFGLHMSPRSRS